MLLLGTGDVFDCGDLLDPANGEVDTSGGTLEGAVATYSCNVGYTINGVDSRTCTAQGWSDKEPTCESKPVAFCAQISIGKINGTLPQYSFSKIYE